VVGERAEGCRSRNFSNVRTYSTGWHACFPLVEGIKRTVPWIEAQAVGGPRGRSEVMLRHPELVDKLASVVASRSGATDRVTLDCLCRHGGRAEHYSVLLVSAVRDQGVNAGGRCRAGRSHRRIRPMLPGWETAFGVIASLLPAVRGLSDILFLSVNLSQPSDNFDLESSHVIPVLIRKFVEAKANGKAKVVAWCDRALAREFLHVENPLRARRTAPLYPAHRFILN